MKPQVAVLLVMAAVVVSVAISELLGRFSGETKSDPNSATKKRLQQEQDAREKKRVR